MHFSLRNSRGFSLVELLVVITIIGILTALTAPSIVSAMKSNAMNSTTAQVAGLIEQARETAVSQNTYVWVAFSPQDSNNTDTLSVAVIESKDGTDPGTYGVVPSTNFALVSKISTFTQYQLQDPGSYTFPALNLPTPGTTSANALSSSSTGPAFSLQIPGTSSTAIFNRCVEFTPSGQARNSTSPINIVEFGVDPANVHTNPNPNNPAVMRINGLTGQVLVYRR